MSSLFGLCNGLCLGPFDLWLASCNNTTIHCLQKIEADLVYQKPMTSSLKKPVPDE